MGSRLAWLVFIASTIGCGSPNHGTVDASDQPEVDGTSFTGEFGDACTKHSDCNAGFCVEPIGDKGGVCSRTCKDDCPTNWECRTVTLPQVELKLCVPAAQQLCLACATDTECGGGACLTLDGGGRCTTPCAGQCPTGYTCAADPSGTHVGTYCQPVTGSCSCSDEMIGATRSCSEANAIGTCFGTQQCSAAGWSTCTATTPADETCDGADNNCNFIIDDGVGGGETCSNTVAGVGTCPGVRACDGSSGFVCLGQTPTMESCNFIDDNCNGSVDEGFVGLGSSCTAGIGACTRYGSLRCNSAGNGLVCSAVAGTGTTELCNQIDDNCNGSTDETFTTLGTQCSAGLGVCARYGTYVCSIDGSTTQCSVAAGTNSSTETCNYLDDNCDGVLDNGFRDPVSGLYTTNTNCGACGTDCTTAFPGAPNATGGCVVTTTATCGLSCNSGYFDLDNAVSDGCEFLLDAASIYVSTSDAAAVDDFACGIGPTGTGTGNHPCKTITFGLGRAGLTGRTNVLVADGTYNEAITLVNGKNVLGGYRPDNWQRHLSTTSTVVQDTSVSGNHDRTVVAINITSATLFEGFIVRGSFNTKAGGNSYAIYVSGSNSNLTIRSNQIFGGRGGPGAVGLPGSNGTAGSNGAAYQQSTYDSFASSGSSACDAADARLAFGGGVRSCPTSDDVGGGNGGGTNCTPLRSTQNSTSASVATAGQPGAGALGGSGGNPGTRGYDGLKSGNTCYLPVQGTTILPTFGSNGTAGGPGAIAPGVAGCTASSGSVSSGHWVGGTASSGLVGGSGGGGGGGGAGGGAACTSCGTPNNNVMFGGHGGGAGTGGCGGSGGGAGGAGGGAFAIFITGGSAPTITSNTLSLGTGGAGGTGGIAGAGGIGGTGTQGGQTGTYFCTGKGGRGGDGGDGGPGSGGGGGCGGSSFGIFTSGIGSPCPIAGNTVTGGSAGPGGSGGYSGGSSGGAGSAGLVQACVSI